MPIWGTRQERSSNMGTKTIFVIQGYDEISGNTLVNVVEFQLYAKNVEEALAKAEKILQKPKYRISSVIEK